MDVSKANKICQTPVSLSILARHFLSISWSGWWVWQIRHDRKADSIFVYLCQLIQYPLFLCVLLYIAIRTIKSINYSQRPMSTILSMKSEAWSTLAFGRPGGWWIDRHGNLLLLPCVVFCTTTWIPLRYTRSRMDTNQTANQWNRSMP